MTGKEAAKIINECKDKGFKHTFYTLNEYHTALDMAAKALEQESCEDAISRQAVHRQINKWVASGESDNDLMSLHNRVDTLSSVNPQPRWIPVSKRLPDIHNCCKKYLVTDCQRHIHTSMFTESGGENLWSYSDVIAWMSLPEPYEPQESEE